MVNVKIRNKKNLVKRLQKSVLSYFNPRNVFIPVCMSPGLSAKVTQFDRTGKQFSDTGDFS